MTDDLEFLLTRIDHIETTIAWNKWMLENPTLLNDLEYHEANLISENIRLEDMLHRLDDLVTAGIQRTLI